MKPLAGREPSYPACYPKEQSFFDLLLRLVYQPCLRCGRGPNPRSRPKGACASPRKSRTIADGPTSADPCLGLRTEKRPPPWKGRALRNDRAFSLRIRRRGCRLYSTPCPRDRCRRRRAPSSCRGPCFWRRAYAYPSRNSSEPPGCSEVSIVRSYEMIPRSEIYFVWCRLNPLAQEPRFRQRSRT